MLKVYRLKDKYRQIATKLQVFHQELYEKKLFEWKGFK